MDSYEFARGTARIMDRDNESDLAKLVEERRPKLIRVTDPSRPYRVLAHIIVDSVAPEMVRKLLPRKVVTVREAAHILGEIADHSHLTPLGTPVVLDRDMHLFVRKTVFTSFLHLLTFNRYDQTKEKQEEAGDGGEIEVRISDNAVFVSHAALLRWSAVILDPVRFEIMADFLRNVSQEQYRLWYFRILATVVSYTDLLDEDALRLILRDLRQPRPMN